MARKKAREFLPEEKKAALEYAAVHGIRAAGRAFDVSHTTILSWEDEFPELWSELRAGTEEAHKIGFARRLEDLAEGYAGVERAALERAEHLIPGANAKELAALVKAMGSARGVATTGARTVRGDPDNVTEVQINFPQLEKAMERLLDQAEPPLQLPNEAVKEVEEHVAG